MQHLFVCLDHCDQGEFQLTLKNFMKYCTLFSNELKACKISCRELPLIEVAVSGHFTKPLNGYKFENETTSMISLTVGTMSESL